MLRILPCQDSDEMAAALERELRIPRHVAAELGRSAVKAAERGYYACKTGKKVNWSRYVHAARTARVSIPPDACLPRGECTSFPEMRVQVANQTTLAAARRLVNSGQKVIALNFANGISPGGGFMNGARAQEEVLCRSSALYETLAGDLMYKAHRKRRKPDSTDWAIYSPDVPVFRTDDGTALEEPWLLSFITCAAPYAPAIGRRRSGALLKRRIRRVLHIARAYGYPALVLGAWGCGAFGNDPYQVALDFRQALETKFHEAFSHVVFAVTDWSPERRFLGAFRDVFDQGKDD